MKWCFRFFLPLLAALTAAASEVTILATAGLHGRLDELSRLAVYCRRAPGAVKVDAGDFSQGTPVTAVLAGRPMAEIFAALGYDLVVPGDTEFDYGPETFAGWEKLLPGRLGGAQWQYGSFRPASAVTVTRQGVTVHLLALGPAALTAQAAAVPALRVQPEELTVRRLLRQLPPSAGPRAVILVWHTGAEDPAAARLLRACPEIDAVIFAPARRCEPGRELAGVWAVQPPPFGQGMAELRLRFLSGGKRPAAALSRILPLPAATPDARVAAIAAAADREAAARCRKPRRTFASAALFAGAAAELATETAGADAAVITLPSRTFRPPELNLLTLAAVMPRNDRLVTAELTPAEFRQALAGIRHRQTGVYLPHPERWQDGGKLRAVFQLNQALASPVLRGKKLTDTGRRCRDLIGEKWL